MDYERGLERLKQLVYNTHQHSEFLTYEQRLRENLDDERLYGTNAQRQSDRAQIIGQLNRLVMQINKNISFNDLCLPGNIPNLQIPPQSSYGSGTSTQRQPASGQSASSQRTIAYISFHPRDKTYLDRLHTHLGLFVRKGMIDYWDRTKSMPGANIRDEITKALNATRVAIVLVSAEYLDAESPDPIASYEFPFLVPAAHKQEITIVSVIVRPCDFAHSDLEPFHPFNPPDRPLSKLKPNEREEIWRQLAEHVRGLLS